MSLLSYSHYRTRRRAEKLYDQAKELINRGMFERAMDIARKLRKVDYDGAYEIEALAHHGLGNMEDAVRVLREGLDRGADVWPIWMLLGTCLSELGRYDEALDAYNEADDFEEVDSDLVNLNRAVVALRQQDFPRVLELVGDPAKSSHPFGAAGLRATALGLLGRHHEAEHLAIRTLDAWLKSDQLTGQRDVGELASIVAGRRFERGEDRTALRSFAIDWWRRSHHERLLVFIRALVPVPSSAEARYFRISFYARFPFADEELEGIHRVKYWMSADMVADNSDEALSLLFEISPPPPGAQIDIDEIIDMEPRPHGLKGVYAASAKQFFKDR
jgi:tetratricopeptide (TPR) repeat protein